MPLILLTMLLPAEVLAQDINNGKTLYNTPFVSGQLSCSAGACHTPNPLNNQNRILLAADSPGTIGAAINTITQMAFMKTHVTGAQLADIAAYIGNPGAATSAPIASVAPATMTFAGTLVGTSSVSQQIVVNNTGTGPLIVAGVSSSSGEFQVQTSCATVAPGSSCSVAVSFAPTSAGQRSGTVSISHNASGGSSVVSVSGVATAPAIQLAPGSITFPLTAVGQASPPQTVTVTSSGSAPLVITSMDVNQNAVFIIGGSCLPGTPIPASGSCTIIMRFLPDVAGPLTGKLTVTQNAGSGVSSVNISATASGPAAAATKSMVEYLYAPLNYFFMTSRDTDKAALDAAPGWQRTGLSFLVYAAADTAGTTGISRFYFDKVAVHSTRGSHFYTLIDSEKTALVQLNPNNTPAPALPFDEGIDSWAFQPVIQGVGGSCANGQIPVYRIFRGNVRFPDDPNHRFTTSTAIYNQFVALGWDGEGVKLCVPAQ